MRLQRMILYSHSWHTGISNVKDALEFLMAGASAIQIGTVNFTNPHAGVEIVEGIEEFMQRERVKSITELVGVAL